jgi:hypothetical protein
MWECRKECNGLTLFGEDILIMQSVATHFTVPLYVETANHDENYCRSSLSQGCCNNQQGMTLNACKVKFAFLLGNCCDPVPHALKIVRWIVCRLIHSVGDIEFYDANNIITVYLDSVPQEKPGLTPDSI